MGRIRPSSTSSSASVFVFGTRILASDDGRRTVAFRRGRSIMPLMKKEGGKRKE